MLLIAGIAVAATDRFRVPQKPAVDAAAGSVPYRGVTTAGQVVPGLFKLALSARPRATTSIPSCARPTATITARTCCGSIINSIGIEPRETGIAAKRNLSPII